MLKETVVFGDERPMHKRFDLVIEGRRNGFHVRVRGLPNVTAQAELYSEAVTRAEEAIREYLELRAIVGSAFLMSASSIEA